MHMSGREVALWAAECPLWALWAAEAAPLPPRPAMAAQSYLWHTYRGTVSAVWKCESMLSTRELASIWQYMTAETASLCWTCVRRYPCTAVTQDGSSKLVDFAGALWSAGEHRGPHKQEASCRYGPSIVCSTQQHYSSESCFRGSECLLYPITSSIPA